MRNSSLAMAAAFCCVVGVCLLSSSDVLTLAVAQTKSKTSKKPTNTKTLDLRALKVQADFVKESTELARSYEAAGELEKAKRIYGALSRLNPQSKEIRDRIKLLDNAILSLNEFDIEIDVAHGWGAPRARVAKGKKFKVQAAGTYKFQATLPLGPAGFRTTDPTKNDLAENIRCGALMGLIVANGKPGKPFLIGADKEISASGSGLLYLRVNVPAGSKCTGRLNVRLGGYVQGL